MRSLKTGEGNVAAAPSGVQDALDAADLVRAGAADALDLLNVKLERLNGVAQWDEVGYRTEVAFGQLEDATQQLLEAKPDVIAPAPPANLEINPRQPKAKP